MGSALWCAGCFRACSGCSGFAQVLLRYPHLGSGMLILSSGQSSSSSRPQTKAEPAKGKIDPDLGESFLLDTPTKRQINLSKQWDACFMPGQRIEMRMIFQKQTRRLNSCPSCGYTSEQRTDKDIECENCGLIFKRVIQIEEPSYGRTS